MSDMRNLEDLLNAVSILVEHDSALIEKREQQDKTTAALVKDLTAQLRDYQQREQQIKNAIATGTATETRKAVGEILNYYHNQLIEGVAGDVQQANAQLQNTVTIATTKVKELSNLSAEMKSTFDTNFKRLKLFSETFEEQNNNLANDAKNTLLSVRTQAKKGAEQYTKELSDTFAKALSWKIASLLGGICACIIAATLFAIWLIVPSKVEIAERQAEYNKLAAAKIAHNVIRNPTDGKYYAIVQKNSCFISPRDNEQYCKFR